MSLKSLEQIVGSDLYEQRSCSGMGSDPFFNVAYNSEETKIVNFPRIIAQKACESCIIKKACQEWSEENGEEFGIWGGQAREVINEEAS